MVKRKQCMQQFLACKSCGETCPSERIEEHVKEMHFWN